MADTCSAQKIQTDGGQKHTEQCVFRGFTFYKNTEQGNAHNIHGGYKPGFPGISIDKSHLLQAGSTEQGNTTEQTGFPQPGSFPFFKGLFQRAFSQIQEKDCGDQEHDGQTVSESLESKGTNPFHTYTLGNEGAAPDQNCRNKGGSTP